jgi:hypothetical protein
LEKRLKTFVSRGPAFEIAADILAAEERRSADPPDS